MFTIERQTKLIEFFPIVREVYIPIPSRFKTKKGLSEKHVRRKLEKEGWTVWRGGLLGIIRNPEIYPNVRKRYEMICGLIVKNYPNILPYLQYLSHVHHGMPDFLCYRRGEFKFVECKLGYENLSDVQRICIKKLILIGFKVEIYRLAENCTKTRLASFNLDTKEKMVLEVQKKLKHR